MTKTYPRAWIDLRFSEVAGMCLRAAFTGPSFGRDAVRRFEIAYADFVGAADALSMPSCRSGLYHSLVALDLPPGSEVILAAYNFWADAAVVLLAGHKPVFVDVDLATQNIDPSLVEAAVTPRTKAVMPTHLNGLPADMPAIMDIARRHGLRVVEDAARACGATYGGRSVGSEDVGVFSFGYGKSFYALAGGMVTSSDTEFMARLRTLTGNFHPCPRKALFVQTAKGAILTYANNPWLYGLTLFPLARENQVGSGKYAGMFQIKKPDYPVPPEAFTRQMHGLQGHLGMGQLERIAATNARRVRNMRILNQELAGVGDLLLPCEPAGGGHTAVHYVVWTEHKDALQRFLFADGIDAQDESAEDVSAMARFKAFAAGPYPNAAKLHGKVLLLPQHPNLTEGDMRFIASRVKAFFAGRGKA